MKLKKKQYNEYYFLDEGVWVRNFTLGEPPPVDQNSHLFSTQDLSVFLENETLNYKQRFPQIGLEPTFLENVIIISDGYDFKNKKKIISDLPKSVFVIGVNKTLDNWYDQNYHPMKYYIVNNPYSQCMKFLPRQGDYYPLCIASVRTHPQFLKMYAKKGIVYTYCPVSNGYYSGLEHGATKYYIDDYRNPICAAISLSYRFFVKRIFLLCHDDCFDDERPGSIPASNNLWTYPQHKLSNNIIDAHLSWLKSLGIKIGYNSDGLKLKSASYIPIEKLNEFFLRET